MANKELSDILASIDELAKRGQITRSKAFASWFAINFFSVDEDEALEAAAADGGNDQGIDLIFYDDTSEEIVVLQAHCPDNTSKKTPKNKWDAVVASIPFVKDPQALISAGRPDLAESLRNMKEAYPEHTVIVGLISLGLKSQEIIDSVTAHQADSKATEVDYFYLGQEDIEAKYRALVNSERGIAEDTLSFSGDYIEDHGEYGRAWIGSVSAQELQRLHKEHNDELFAGNIRLFLGARKGGINEQIIKTAKEEPGSFWALNNGITIVADTVDLLDKQHDGSTLRLKRFSIVNGCQTTSSLVQAKATPKAKVLARIIAAKSSIKTDIVRYNNSQNAVKIWSVRSADNIQQTLREQFKSVGINYAPKLAGARKKKDQNIIELDRLAQYLAASHQEFLVQAVGNKGELFDQPYQKIFHKGIQAPEAYLGWLIDTMSDFERQQLLEGIGNDQNSGLLSVASTYWICYCTHKLIKKFSKIDSPHMNLRSMSSTEFHNGIKKYTSKATAMFYDAAVDAYDRDTYGSFKSTLRSSKFLQKIDSKINLRVSQLAAKTLPDLAVVSRGVKT
ncbi:AIPR family protein [Methylobacterium haplocladii]|uniref:Abortive phage infection protein C-terminal domain-containing protein n=1 Tax=Methylobacterium haplocladii TaxID=1176176 RepID=A0A512IMW9_9HYPH|nr:AIPR family protein [Methylobacterium haplocladii]GEO99050.1 hypothetical protein MHA02_14380 [Methylobacterium haplocladii]GJD84104.1 hypothetical protein HPGCJGGD_1979 [Methylobacterium haplocladii]GLS58950.1 hypothetical protein GCM10007887_16160 [Methylobacterium haplocladii]